MRQQRAGDSVLVQIGANDHGQNRRVGADHDPALLGVQLGWRALLLEPTLHAFTKLQSRYADSSRVRTRHAAVCANDHHHARCTATTNRTARMWVVDPTNATGNWGSADADMRCVTELESQLNITSFHYLLELSSFERGHVLKHENNLVANAPKNCRVCSKVPSPPPTPLPTRCCLTAAFDPAAAPSLLPSLGPCLFARHLRPRPPPAAVSCSTRHTRFCLMGVWADGRATSHAGWSPRA